MRIKPGVTAGAIGLALFAGDLPTDAQHTTTNDTVYLFSTFKEPEQDGLRFAYSFDGYHWTNVPGLVDQR